MVLINISFDDKGTLGIELGLFFQVSQQALDAVLEVVISFLCTDILTNHFFNALSGIFNDLLQIGIVLGRIQHGLDNIQSIFFVELQGQNGAFLLHAAHFQSGSSLIHVFQSGQNDGQITIQHLGQGLSVGQSICKLSQHCGRRHAAGDHIGNILTGFDLQPLVVQLGQTDMHDGIRHVHQQVCGDDMLTFQAQSHLDCLLLAVHAHIQIQVDLFQERDVHGCRAGKNSLLKQIQCGVAHGQGHVHLGTAGLSGCGAVAQSGQDLAVNFAYGVNCIAQVVFTQLLQVFFFFQAHVVQSMVVVVVVGVLGVSRLTACQHGDAAQNQCGHHDHGQNGSK